MNATVWIVVALLVVAPLMWRLRPVRSEQVRPAPRVARSAGPMAPQLQHSPVLVFRASPDACDVARRLDGKRCERGIAAAAAMPTCANGQCSCRYVALSDQRKSPERRRRIDRRDAVRFDLKKIDRRRNDRRHSGSAWSPGKNY